MIDQMIKGVFPWAGMPKEELEHRKGMLSSYDLPFSFYKVGLDIENILSDGRDREKISIALAIRSFDLLQRMRSKLCY